MAVTNYQLGSLKAVLYFINVSGEIHLPPSDEQAYRVKDEMRKRGFELREADTIPKIDDLSRRIFEYEKRKLDSRLEAESYMYDLLQRRVKDSMMSRAVSSSTTPYERDFIMYYLQHTSAEKKAKFMANFEHRQMFFEKREYDGNNGFLDLAEKAAPDSAETRCNRCRKFRRIKGSQLCMGCAAEVGEEIQRQGGR